LRRVELDRIKIDRSFVGEIPNNSDDSKITAAIIAMAHSLNLSVVAEGVETEEQVLFLRNRGCDELQGILLGSPMDGTTFPKFLVPEKDA
jgi:EAL domain-containing protein (putative c-di-GMP-specific phosphodiesterase class I)